MKTYGRKMNLERYGITIERTKLTGLAWRVVNIEKLPGDENKGRRNVYVNAIGADGKHSPFKVFRGGGKVYPLDKPNSRQGHGYLQMHNDAISVEMFVGSDIVHGLHANHPDEDPGNTRGHHSFRITFQFAHGKAVVGPPLTQREIVVSADQSPSEQADALLDMFGDQHCAALAQLLSAFVQAQRMRQYNAAIR